MLEIPRNFIRCLRHKEEPCGKPATARAKNTKKNANKKI